MPLQQGEVQGYDFNRSVVEFTMLNQGKIILCSISTAAMDDLEGRRGVKPDQRVDQFMRLPQSHRSNSGERRLVLFTIRLFGKVLSCSFMAHLRRPVLSGLKVSE
jgi:hypothetical protein